MTALAWSCVGLSVNAAILHGALGLRRLVDWKYLAFAGMMVLLALFSYFDVQVNRSTVLDDAVAWTRHQQTCAAGLLALFAWFFQAYTRVEIPKTVTRAFWICLVGVVIYNALSPSGIHVGSAPQLVTVRVLGEEGNHVVSQLGSVQVAYHLLVATLFGAAIGAGVRMFRRGERRKGGLFVVAISPLLVATLLDLAHDFMSGLWPYPSTYASLSLSVVMSVQLAVDFRLKDRELTTTLERSEEHAAKLAHMLQTSLELRDKLNTPLQTLEMGLALRARRSPGDAAIVTPLLQQVSRLIKLSRAIRRASTPEGEANVTKRGLLS